MKNIESLAVALTLATLTGCAAVPQGDINKRAEAMRSEIADRVAAQSVPVTMPLVERVRGSYLGGESVALAYDATLPAIFSDVKREFERRYFPIEQAPRVAECRP